MNTLSIINEDLITPFDFDQLYAQEKDKFDQEMESKQGANKCKNFVLTKKYIDRDELEEDQDGEIFYDKNYDFTDYPFLKKHENIIFVSGARVIPCFIGLNNARFEHTHWKT